MPSRVVYDHLRSSMIIGACSEPSLCNESICAIIEIGIEMTMKKMQYKSLIHDLRILTDCSKYCNILVNYARSKSVKIL